MSRIYIWWPMPTAPSRTAPPPMFVLQLMSIMLSAVQEVGYFVVLYRQPTGPSAGSLPAFHGERSPMQSFTGNRAHSNQRVRFRR